MSVSSTTLDTVVFETTSTSLDSVVSETASNSDDSSMGLWLDFL